MLWANDQLYAIANHTTAQLKYPRLGRPILPQKQVGGILFHIIMLPLLLGLTALCLWILLAYTTAAIHGRTETQRWRYGEAAVDAAFAHPEVHPIMHNPMTAAIFIMGTLSVGLTPSVLMAISNNRNRRYNAAQRAYLTYTLRQAEEKWIRQYAPPRGATLR